MFRRLTLAACAAAAIASVPSGAFAQGTAEKMGISDALFAATAADGGMFEVATSEIAAKKASDPELKKYAEHMIEAHTKANNELKAMAAQKGIALPAAMSPGHQLCGQSLAGLSGEDFNTSYAAGQYVGHMATVAAFETEIAQGQDPEMKAWATKTLPHLKEHLKEIKPIAMMYHEKKEKKEKGEK